MLAKDILLIPPSSNQNFLSARPYTYRGQDFIAVVIQKVENGIIPILEVVKKLVRFKLVEVIAGAIIEQH